MQVFGYDLEVTKKQTL